MGAVISQRQLSCQPIPPLAAWTVAQPPQITLFFSFFSYVSHTHTHARARAYTHAHTLSSCSVIDGIFRSAADLLSAALQLDLRLLSLHAALFSEVRRVSRAQKP